MVDNKGSILFGIHPILEALKSSKRRCYKIIVKEGTSNSRIQTIKTLATSLQTKIETLPNRDFQKKYGDLAHQGIIGHFSPNQAWEINDLIQKAFQISPSPTLVLLDEIQDPQNLGAIIRSAEALGIQGIILPERRSAPVTETVAKCSAGAVEFLPIASVSNLVNAVEILKKAGFWAVGADSTAETPCHEMKFDFPVALIIGGEGKGIRPLLRKKCDFTIHIPMAGQLDSLNAAAASAVIFYEILRQKNTGDGTWAKKNGEKP